MIAADQDFLGSALLLKVKRPPGFGQTENVMTKRGEKSEKTTGKTPEVCFNKRKPREEREKREEREEREERNCWQKCSD